MYSSKGKGKLMMTPQASYEYEESDTLYDNLWTYVKMDSDTMPYKLTEGWKDYKFKNRNCDHFPALGV